MNSRKGDAPRAPELVYIGSTVTPTVHRVLALSLLAAGAALGQTPPSLTPQYSEEIEVRVIDVDVVVTDRQGNPVTDLAREDFDLFENGRPVAIDYFSRTVSGRIADAALPPALPGQPAPEPPRIPVTWVIYIDHTNLLPQNRNYAMRQLQDFLGAAITRGDRGVIALNDGRAFKIRQNVTSDPKLLMTALAKMEREQMSVSPTKRQALNLLNQMRRNEQEWGVPPPNGLFIPRDETEYMASTAAGQIEALIREEAGRTKAAIRAVGALLDALAELEGRLALVYIGAGFNSLPVADLAAVWRTRYSEKLGSVTFEPKPEQERDPIEREITKLYDNLSAHRVTVYTIHGGERGAGISVEDPGQTDVEMANTTDLVPLTETASAREMADRTGGLFFRVNPGLAGQLDAVIRDFDNYYSLGYKPEGSPNKTRRVDVKVKRDGLRVRHRETVRERTRSEKAAGAVVAAMVQPQPRAARRVDAPAVPAAVANQANPLGVAVEANRPTREAQFLSFIFSLQLERLAFVREHDAHRARFAMHFALVTPDGSIVPLDSREQTLAIPLADLAPAEVKPTAEQLLAYSWHVDVSPLRLPENVPAWQEGTMLSVTVEDRTSGERSVVTVPLEKK